MPHSRSSPPIKRQSLYGGEKSAARFSKAFLRMLDTIPDTVDLGCKKKDLGVHSASRKGPVTYTLNLSTSISAPQVYLRAGWSLGNVQDRYIFAGAGGDQLAGRAVCGLPVNLPDFAILPPHFSAEDKNLLDCIGWENIFPRYGNYPSGFQRAIPYLAASLIYHQQYLKDSLSSKHPLFCKPLFNSTVTYAGRSFTIAEEFAGRILTGRNYCSLTNMQATGVPPHLAIVSEVAELKNQGCELQSELQANSASTLKTVLQQFTELPSRVSEELRSKFSIEGVVPVTIDDVQKLIEESSKTLLAGVSNLLEHRSGVNSSYAVDNNNSRDQQQAENAVNAFLYKVYSWGGAYHMVPEAFVFPSYSVKTMHDLWYFGNNQLQVRPYMKLEKFPGDVRKKDRTVYSKTRKVMNELQRILREDLQVSSGFYVGMGRQYSDENFDLAFSKLLSALYPSAANKDTPAAYSPPREGDLNICTIGNKLYKKNS